MRLSDFKALTFDTYGTVIDWEAGILAALRPLTAKLDSKLTREQILAAFGEEESAQQAETPAMIYSALLAATYLRLAKRWKLAATEAEAKAFGGSVGDWPAFPDSKDALAYLKKHYTLVTVTNCDRESYKGSSRQLDHPWHAIWTAQDIGSYKPSPRNFAYMLEHMRSEFGIEKDKILHTAQSLFHDHVPATALGLATAWINRQHDKKGHGATPPPPGPYRIDFQFNSLAEMAEAHKREVGSA